MKLIVKSREKSSELQIMTSLNSRMKLSEKDSLHYYNLNKGYEGEVMFDGYLLKLQCECLILNDLLFKVNQTTFQIDSLMMSDDSIFVFEVKNFEGDYYYDSTSDKIFTRSKNFDIVNPLTQLMRSESLLNQLLRSEGFKYPIKSSVVFVNPEFTLYQAPMNKPFLYPTQLIRFFEQLNTKPSRIANKSKLLAEKLLSLHQPESQYSQVPPYEYKQLKKGILCAGCHSFLDTVEGRSCICTVCGHKESVKSAVLRSVREFKLLFPEERITTSGIFEWCELDVSRKSIQRILENNLEMVSSFRWAYFK